MTAPSTTAPSATIGAGLTAGVCIIHLIRGTFRFVSRKYWDTFAKDLKPIYQADTSTAAAGALDALETKWGRQYPATIRLWRSRRGRSPSEFLDYDVPDPAGHRSTNAIESLNAHYRRAVRARGHFPNEQSAMKTLHLVTRSLDPTGTGQTRWAVRWKPALNAFAITYADRTPSAEHR